MPSGATSESAYFTRGAGHGRMCGRATTKKLATTVVAKSEDVIRDRGCRCGGMADSGGRRKAEIGILIHLL